MKAELSIIIPTHKRADILQRCLTCIEKQSVAQKIEVIVVSDGHDDNTSSLFDKNTFQIPVQFYEIKKSQQGVARNFGVQKASADLVLFIGDDAFLEKDTCEQHLRCHGERSRTMTPPQSSFDYAQDDNLAVLGFTTWDPTLEITPVMKWLEKSGWQFGYPNIAKYAGKMIPQNIQHQFTYTIHISLPTEIAKAHPFREDMTLYGWEDVEWGQRLQNAGVKLLYEPKAVAFHYHAMSLEDSLRRMETIGQSAVLMERQVDGFDRAPKSFKLMLYKLAALLPTIAGKHRKAFLRGIHSINSK